MVWNLGLDFTSKYAIPFMLHKISTQKIYETLMCYSIYLNLIRFTVVFSCGGLFLTLYNAVINI